MTLKNQFQESTIFSSIFHSVLYLQKYLNVTQRWKNPVNIVEKLNWRSPAYYSFNVQVIQAKLEEAESDIAEAKTELEAARLVRRNRMEYDSMAKSIAAFPSRY